MSQFPFFNSRSRTRKLNSWYGSDVESDAGIDESSLRRLFDGECDESCRVRILANIYESLKCAEVQNLIGRERRAKWDVLTRDDLFMPVRGRRRSDQAPEITAEKKAKLDILANDLFLPHRGRRHMSRKNLLRMDLNPFIRKRNGIDEFSVKDFFVPNRGKRQQNAIDNIFSDNFFPQRGKKVIIPRSHTPLSAAAAAATHALDPWLFQNINSDDSSMIDRQQRDFNLFGIEVRREETKTTETKIMKA